MKVLMKKWGNSAFVRIPAAVMAASGLAVDQPVDVREEGGRIVIEPIRGNELEVLVAGITPDNLHREVCSGPAVGKEFDFCPGR
ncbi:AbrB/MazE/SpoVT family DNA-binding domain-containing protein [Burkholderia pseudomallei]|uniref:AbrB/MazE/SpoVT family DNA-binding domain-containing protein n=1 Tax=Burkholderia pseudomallei TaxID=28450 RepID=UPI0009E4E9E4|nr:AbrB/MazE/SpoVT family DNA-binding domain-containing protein [Burkholderia pseudomallei]